MLAVSALNFVGGECAFFVDDVRAVLYYDDGRTVLAIRKDV